MEAAAIRFKIKGHLTTYPDPHILLSTAYTRSTNPQNLDNLRVSVALPVVNGEAYIPPPWTLAKKLNELKYTSKNLNISESELKKAIKKIRGITFVSRSVLHIDPTSDEKLEEIIKKMKDYVTVREDIIHMGNVLDRLTNMSDVYTRMYLSVVHRSPSRSDEEDCIVGKGREKPIQEFEVWMMGEKTAMKEFAYSLRDAPIGGKKTIGAYVENVVYRDLPHDVNLSENGGMLLSLAECKNNRCYGSIIKKHLYCSKEGKIIRISMGFYRWGTIIERLTNNKNNNNLENLCESLMIAGRKAGFFVRPLFLRLDNNWMEVRD